MTLEQAIHYSLSKKGAKESYPFDAETLVFKVGSKMFGLVYQKDHQIGLNLKCDPEWAILLRQKHASIIPGYHMNKKHWNTVLLDGTLSEELTKDLIDHSYTLVFKTLKKAEKEEIEAL